MALVILHPIVNVRTMLKAGSVTTIQSIYTSSSFSVAKHSVKTFLKGIYPCGYMNNFDPVGLRTRRVTISKFDIM